MYDFVPKLPAAERSRRNAIIVSEFAQIHDALTELKAPGGHVLKSIGHQTTWFLQDPLNSVSGTGASAYFRKTGAEAADPDQFHGEIRIHWDRFRRTELKDDQTYIKATLWAEWGARYFRSERKLLLPDRIDGHRADFLYADSVESLIGLIVNAFTPALAAAQILVDETTRASNPT